MKLQGISVIFALIVLPLILVLTYYIHLQVDTIEMQNELDKKLLDSTYGAMSAFEINTANEDLSTVSDSLRTIIDASTNIFMNTLATNFGMSNASSSYLEPYIPAILYTLYDGYYITAPTRTPKILTDYDGNAVYVGDTGLTVSGSNYSFTMVHTNLESQNNCTDCIITREPGTGKITGVAKGPGNHILYDNLDATHDAINEYAYMSSEKQAELQIKYDKLVNKEDYGQLLYLKKGTTNQYTADVNDAEVEIKHVLKTYMPYSARYKDGTNFDIVAVYTLDNYLSIEGTINDIYYTKSGYFMPKDSVSIININGSATPTEKLLLYNENDAKKFIEDGNYVEIELLDGTTLSSGSEDPAIRKNKAQLEERLRILNKNYTEVTAMIAQFEKGIGVDISAITTWTDNSGNNYVYTGADDKAKVKEAKAFLSNDMNNIQYSLDEMSSVSYYVAAEIFSDWVYEKLVNTNKVKEKHLIEISGQEYNLIKGEMQVSHDFSGSEIEVFNIVGTNNIYSKLNSPMEIDKDSAYYSHKLNVIRDSIQYNLNLAMTTYNNMSISTKDYAMPVMENEEWEKILNHVSIVSFMQGYNCGLKTYNNYKIVSSTNNEISLLPEEIYYVKKEDFSNEDAEYHRIDCPKLWKIDTGTTNQYLSFISKEVKYDKLYDKTNALVPYQYDHKNLACYECINDGNYKGEKIFDDTTTYRNLLKAYYIGVGKSRNNLYKMNAFNNSEGYEILYDKDLGEGALAKTSKYGLEKIKAIEIVLDTIKTSDIEENVLNYKVRVDATYLTDTIFTIVPNVTTKSTIKINVNPNLTGASVISANQLIFENQFPQSTAYCAETQTNEETNPDYYAGNFDEKSSIIFKDAIRFVKVIYR